MDQCLSCYSFPKFKWNQLRLYLIWYYIQFLCSLGLSAIPCWTPYYSACCFSFLYNDSCKAVWLVSKAYLAWTLVQHYSYLIYYQITFTHIWNSLVSDNMISLQGINSKINFVHATRKLRCLTWSTMCVFSCYISSNPTLPLVPSGERGV